MAITVSLSFAPELVMAIADVRDARRLRGRPVRGVAGSAGHGRAGARARPRPVAAAGLVDGRPGLRPPGAGGPGRPTLGDGRRPRSGCCWCWPGSTACWWPARCPAGASPSWPSGAVLVGVGPGRRRAPHQPHPVPARPLADARSGWWSARVSSWWPRLVAAGVARRPRPAVRGLSRSTARPCRSWPPSGSWSAWCRPGSPRWHGRRCRSDPSGPGGVDAAGRPRQPARPAGAGSGGDPAPDRSQPDPSAAGGPTGEPVHDPLRRTSRSPTTAPTARPSTASTWPSARGSCAWWSGPTGLGQDHAAPGRQRAGAPLHRRPAVGRGAGRRPLDPGLPAPGAGRRGRAWSARTRPPAS